MGKTVITLLLLLITFAGHAQQDWHLKRDEDGVKVYTAATPNSNFKSIKVECTIHATLTQLVAFLLDIEKQPQWVFNCKSVHLVKKVAPNEYIFYSEVNVPWPCTNRDYVAHFVITQSAPGSLTVNSHAEPDMLPEKDGIVRVKNSVAHWEITTVSPGVLKAVYTVQFDPAGSIPAWLTNMFVTKGPYETFEGLKKGLDKPIYKQARIDFIKD